MNDDGLIPDGRIAGMLSRRAARGDVSGLEAQIQGAVLEAPQRTGPFGWLRPPPGRGVHFATIGVMALAAAVIIGAVGIVLISGAPSPGLGPWSPTPTPDPTPNITPRASTSAEIHLPRPWTTLGPGRHVAGTFWPDLRLTTEDTWLSEPGSDMFFSVVPANDANVRAVRSAGFPVTFVDVFRNISVAAADCTDAAEPGVGPTATDIVGALAVRPGLIVTEPIAVTIGGLRGEMVDLELDPDSGGRCPAVENPYVPLIYAPDFLTWGVEPGEKWRIVVIDVAPLPPDMFATVMIVIWSSDEAAWDDHLAVSMPLLETFEFTVTPPAP
jgi:hypothetical protein